MALFEPQRSGVQTGFIVSTIGITAIVIGRHTVKVARWGSSIARAFGRGGVLLGSVGSALMAYAVVAVLLAGVGVYLPALSLPVESSGTVIRGMPLPTPTSASDIDARATPPAAPSAEVPAAPAGDQAPTSSTGQAGTAPAPVPPAPSVPATLEEERSAVVQSAGTLSYVMRHRFAGGAYPASLAVGGAAPERIMLADGTALASVPDGSRIVYSVAPDGSAWAITIIGARFGAVATYSSTVGTVQVG